MILLDTNALIWIDRRHPRVRRLLATGQRLHISPANLLELQFLHETGQIRLRTATIESLAGDDRWQLDEPAAAAWFLQALDLSWTRDPFDRLLVAHALLRRGRLATADGNLLNRLGPRASIAL